MSGPNIFARAKRKESSPLRFLLALAGLVLVSIAAFRPQWGRAHVETLSRARNVVIAIDVSRSMLAEDVRPNRLERAKADVADMIDSLGGDRAALVAFRRTGVAVCPLTSDRAYLRSALEALTPDSAPRGETDLGSAIRESLNLISADSSAPGLADDHSAIIIISDGGDLRGGALDAAQQAKKRSIPIFTIGIGDPHTGAPIPSEDGRGTQRFKGEEVRVKLDEAPLRAIAEASGGRYVPLATAGTAETTLGAIYRRFLRQVAAKEQNEAEDRKVERYQWFLVPGLVFLMAAAALSRGRLPKARTDRKHLKVEKRQI